MNEPPDARSLAARLRSLRGDLGLSQEQLARRLGVSFATVNRWESGRTSLSARAVDAIAALEAEVAAAAGAGAAGAGQTAGHSAPPARTEPGTHSALPVAQSSFVGRERELAELAGLMAGSRLLTLTGPGGAGKTRLAIELVRRGFGDNEVVFVPLESVRFPQSLASALASQLGVHDQPGKPLTESLTDALVAAPRLLLLDGAESLRDQVADLAGQLLSGVPGLRVVVTSRVILGVPGEVCWAVPPLACPSVAAGASDIASSDAVRLFVARAAERVPGFRASDVAPHAIAELCRRLDGLPLAIELIAGWVGTLSLGEILQQRAVLLATEPARAGQPRSRRLADVLQLSYDLLGPDQRRMAAMLSVFAGSFGVADMQAVLGLDAAAAAGTARLLVDSSWLDVTRGSDQNLFRMLDIIRSFAALQLDKTADGQAVRRRHAAHMAELAVASERELTGPDAARWTSRMEAAVPDLDLALQWAQDNADVDLGLDISGSLWRWWLFSGRLAVGRTWLARFLGMAGERADFRTGRAYCSAAVLAAENGDYAEAIRAAEISLRIFEPLDETNRRAFAATVLGSAHRYLGDIGAARRYYQLALDLRGGLMDAQTVAVMNNLAVLELDDGAPDKARELFEQVLVVKRQIGEHRSIAISLLNLAEAQIQTGRWAAADGALREALELAADSPQLAGGVRCSQGNLAARRGNWKQAAEHYRAVTSSGAGGHPDVVIEAMIGLGRVCRQLGRPDEAARHLRDAQDLAGQIASPKWTAQVQAALAEPAGVAAAPLPGNLTRRQAEVLGKLAAGLSNKQIAAELYLSPATVERHLATIYAKLGLSGRVDAARYAIENGLSRDPAEPPPAVP
jgi:predicted ATPase/DNA-binding CsgD family transcriptional regulator/DNA-binding XRE family transcriptional regulator/Flp pilus assembly protein TadD